MFFELLGNSCSRCKFSVEPLTFHFLTWKELEWSRASRLPKLASWVHAIRKRSGSQSSWLANTQVILEHSFTLGSPWFQEPSPIRHGSDKKVTMPLACLRHDCPTGIRVIVDRSRVIVWRLPVSRRKTFKMDKVSCYLVLSKRDMIIQL